MIHLCVICGARPSTLSSFGFFFFFGCTAPPAVETQCLNHWTVKEFLEVTTLEIKNCGYFGGRPGAMNGMRLVEGNWGSWPSSSF